RGGPLWPGTGATPPAGRVCAAGHRGPMSHWPPVACCGPTPGADAKPRRRSRKLRLLIRLSRPSVPDALSHHTATGSAGLCPELTWEYGLAVKTQEQCWDTRPRCERRRQPSSLALRAGVGFGPLLLRNGPTIKPGSALVRIRPAVSRGPSLPGRAGSAG